jgi:hypothetical protein
MLTGLYGPDPWPYAYHAIPPLTLNVMPVDPFT